MVDILFERDAAHKDMVFYKQCSPFALLLGEAEFLRKARDQLRTHFTVILFATLACIVQQNHSFDKLPLFLIEAVVDLCDKRVFDIFERFDTLDGVQIDGVGMIAVKLRQMQYFAEVGKEFVQDARIIEEF